MAATFPNIVPVWIHRGLLIFAAKYHFVTCPHLLPVVDWPSVTTAVLYTWPSQLVCRQSLFSEEVTLTGSCLPATPPRTNLYIIRWIAIIVTGNVFILRQDVSKKSK